MVRAAVLAAFSAADHGRRPPGRRRGAARPHRAGGAAPAARRRLHRAGRAIRSSAVGTVAVLGLGQLALHQLIELLNPTHAAHHRADAAAPSGTAMFAMHAGGHPGRRGRAALRRPRRSPRSAPHCAGWCRAGPPALCADRPLATLATARPGRLAAPRPRPRPPPSSGAALRWGADPAPAPLPTPRSTTHVLVNPSVARCAPASCPPRRRHRAAGRRHPRAGPRHRPARPGRAGRLRGHLPARAHRVRHGRHGETPGHPAHRHTRSPRCAPPRGRAGPRP